MRKTFPGHFRPTNEEFVALWAECLFVIDANVLLNLYRYSPETRQELERALESVKQRLFVPHQAAKEFLKNRLVVTARHAAEYSTAIKTITELTSNLSNKKKHPFLPDTDLSKFIEQVDDLVEKLEAQKTALSERLNNDEILEFVQLLSDNKTGVAFDEATLADIAAEGEKRYQNEIPPGYKDGKKDASGDPFRKFGDLILWKQLLIKVKNESKSVIFITDDKKEDWWLEQSGRTIGPRAELRDEFISEVGESFWMYTVDKFIEEVTRTSEVPVSKQVIAEIIEVQKEVKENRLNRLAELAKLGEPLDIEIGNFAKQLEKKFASGYSMLEQNKFKTYIDALNEASHKVSIKNHVSMLSFEEQEKYGALFDGRFQAPSAKSAA